MGPIDYSINVATPIQSAVQGLQLGAGMANMEAAQQAQQAEIMAKQHAAERQQLLSQRINQVYNKPNKTAEDFVGLAMLLPEKDAKSMRENWETLGKEKQQSSLRNVTEVYSALQSGRPDIAIERMKGHAEALRNSGDEQQAKLMEAMAKVAEIDPKFATTDLGLKIAGLPGGKEALEGIDKFLGTQRAEAAEPQKQRIALEEHAAKLGLTKAETNKTIIEGKKISAETVKIMQELEALKKTGGIDPSKQFETEQKLRKEYSDQTKQYQEVSESFRRVSAAENSGPGDIALIYGYMKMLDPGSVVREGEFATAQNSGGIPQAVVNAYNKALSGQRLSPEQRKSFTGQAKKLHEASSVREKQVRDGLGKVAKSYGLNAENIFSVGGTESTQERPQQQPQNPAAAVPSMPPPGAVRRKG